MKKTINITAVVSFLAVFMFMGCGIGNYNWTPRQPSSPEEFERWLERLGYVYNPGIKAAWLFEDGEFAFNITNSVVNTRTLNLGVDEVMCGTYTVKYYRGKYMLHLSTYSISSSTRPGNLKLNETHIDTPVQTVVTILKTSENTVKIDGVNYRR